MYVFKNNYPKYFKRLYGQEVVEINQIRDKLASNTALIEYIVSDDFLFIILILKDSVIFEKVPFDRLILNQIAQINKYAKDIDASENGNQLIYLLRQLYTKLIEPLDDQLKNNNVNQIVIIPDLELNYLPFESLVTSAVPKGFNNYKSVNYLLQQYDISYHYSTNLFYN